MCPPGASAIQGGFGSVTVLVESVLLKQCINEGLLGHVTINMVAAASPLEFDAKEEQGGSHEIDCGEGAKPFFKFFFNFL